MSVLGLRMQIFPAATSFFKKVHLLERSSRNNILTLPRDVLLKMCGGEMRPQLQRKLQFTLVSCMRKITDMENSTISMGEGYILDHIMG